MAQRIENFNCEGLCQERYCSERYSYFEWLEVNGITFCVLLCEKHAAELEKRFWEKKDAD